MITLAVDSSAAQASVCLMQDETILGEFYMNTKQKHSRTLMIMVEQLLSCGGILPKDVDLFAVTAGPGSFTGIRIGVSCVKGMAFPFGTPCVGVSTLEALAFGGSEIGQLICPVMDARCKQVYTALFRMGENGPERLEEDQVLPIAQLGESLKARNESVLLIGDGAELCKKDPSFEGIEVKTLNAYSGANHASYVAMAAQKLYQKGIVGTPADLSPIYLSMPQAQRERLKQKEENK